jgi:hypothetical protein
MFSISAICAAVIALANGIQLKTRSALDHSSSVSVATALCAPGGRAILETGKRHKDLEAC